MEEKKTIKISLSTFFLILAIIVIVIMGVFIFKFYNDKKVADSEVKDLNNQVIGLESTIDTLEGKINSIEGTINNTTNNIVDSENVENTQNNTTSKTFSNAEIKKAIQDYLDLMGAYSGQPSALLNKLGFKDFVEYDIVIEENYRKTNISYAEYKNRMLNYVTEEWFKSKFEKDFKDVDGNLYYFNWGATGMDFDVESVNIKGDYSNSSYIANVYNIHIDESKELEHVEFHIADYNGKCVISYCDY